MSQSLFSTVAEAQEQARRRLPRSVYEVLVGGYEREITSNDNVACFDEIGFFPRTVNLPNKRSLSTRVLGLDMPMPLICSPAGVHAVHPDGELAVAKATAAQGIAMGLSSFAGKSIEEVVAVNPRTFCQMYWIGSREQIARRVARAKAAGAAGLIITLDWCFPTGRDRGTAGSAAVPHKWLSLDALPLAGEALRRPRWLLRYLRRGALPSLSVPNLATQGNPMPGFMEAYGWWMATPAPTWDDVRWLGEQWGGTYIVKGIVRPEEARLAVEAGATAISVSNHGGNNLDGTPAALRALPAIVDAVGDKAEVLLDGGVRRGGDVAKALAFGAKAVMVGRPYLFALGANGTEGVENLLAVIRAGLDYTLYGLGHSSVHELNRKDLYIPRDFCRTFE